MKLAEKEVGFIVAKPVVIVHLEYAQIIVSAVIALTKKLYARITSSKLVIEELMKWLYSPPEL